MTQEHFEDFYEELSKFGEIENLNVCDNLADHMIGNVYVQFREEDQAAAAHIALHGRFYSGRPIIVDFSPVTDFREATCRQYEENSCNRDGYCNFMHVKQIGRDLRKKLFGRYRRSHRGRSRSASPHHRRERRERDDHRGCDGYPHRGRDDYRGGGGRQRGGSNQHDYRGGVVDGGRRRHGDSPPGVQEALSGRTVRRIGRRLNSGTVKGRKSKGEALGKQSMASLFC